MHVLYIQNQRSSVSSPILLIRPVQSTAFKFCPRLFIFYLLFLFQCFNKKSFHKLMYLTGGRARIDRGRVRGQGQNLGSDNRLPWISLFTNFMGTSYLSEKVLYSEKVQQNWGSIWGILKKRAAYLSYTLHEFILTGIARLVHVFDLNLTTQILIIPC